MGVGSLLFGVAVAILAMQLTKHYRTERPEVPFLISRAAARQLDATPERAKAVRGVIDQIAPLRDAGIAELQAWLDQRKRPES